MLKGFVTRFIGTVFDVSHKRETYGKGGSYSLFAGKDASKALGKSSLKEEDASPDYSDLPEPEMKVLNEWHAFFLCVHFSFLVSLLSFKFLMFFLFLFPSILVCCRKRYNVVGKVVNLPPAVANL